MSTVTSYSQLLAELKKVRNNALKGAAEEATELGKEVIQRVVYDVGTPQDYDRTYDLKNSLRDNPIEGSGSSSATVKIDHDTSLIHSDSVGYQHYSPTWGNSHEYIAKIVHDGLSGDMFGTNHLGMRARPYMDDTENELKNGKYKKFMMDEIKGMGFKVK